MGEIVTLNQRLRLDLHAKVLLGNVGIGEVVGVDGHLRTIEFERFTPEGGFGTVVETLPLDDLRALNPAVDWFGRRNADKATVHAFTRAPATR
jgi:hypothetical protein